MNIPGDVVRCIATDADLDIYIRKPIIGKLYTVHETPAHLDKGATCIKLHDGHLYVFSNSFFINIATERDEKLNKLLK